MHKFNEELFQNAVDLNETIVFEYDIDNDVMRFADNISKYMPCSERIHQYLEEMEFRGKVHSDDIKKAISFFQSKEDDGQIRVQYLRFLDFNGNYPWYQVRGKLIVDENRQSKLLYGTYTCVDSNKYLAEELNNKFVKDALTKLDNRENTIIKIHQYFEEMPEGVIPGIILLDIDNFKDIVKFHGENVGDSALMETARILRRALRGSDIIGRYGRDQFLICIKGVRDEKVFCERSSYILDTMKQVWSDYHNDCKLSACIGIAIAVSKEDKNFQRLWDKVQSALCLAKSKKKDTYVLYGKEMLGEEHFQNVHISGHEIELVRNILDPIMTWAYAVDENFHLIYKNAALDKRIAGECDGLCYDKLKGYAAPCPDCPLVRMKERTTALDSEIYSPSLRRMVQFRTTQIILRNGMKVFIMTNVNEDLNEQVKNLRESTEHFNLSVQKIHDIIWEINLTKNRIVRIREANILSILEQRVDQYQTVRKYMLDHVVHPNDRDAFLYVSDPGRIREAKKMGKELVRKEVRFLQQNYSYRYYSVTSVVELDEDGNGDERVFLTATDIHDLKEEIIERFTIEEKYKYMMHNSQCQKEIAQCNERYEHVNELTGIFVFEYNVPDKEYYVCTSFEEVFSLKKNMLVDEWSFLMGLTPYKADQKKYDSFVELVKREPDTHEITIRFINRYGVPVWFTLTVQTLKGLNNTLTRVLGILQNVHNEMEIKAELEFRANYDSMTGLYNNERFCKCAEEYLFMYPERDFAIIAVDIDRFRMINDRYGIEAGNRCLQHMGNIIRQNLAEDNIASRYQSDVFHILIDYKSDQDILKYVEELTQQFTFEEATKYGSTLSFGVYKIEDRKIPVRVMCDRASLAKKEIKGNVLCNISVYNDAIRILMEEQAEIESEMQAALDHKEFVMYLQPKYDLATEKLCGAEALVRWQHPTKGLRMPGDFLPLFEHNGFVKNLDEYMWESAANYLADLEKRNIKIPISVNISRVHINNTCLIEVLGGIVEKYHIDPQLLELEITENLFMQDVSLLYDSMLELKKAGFIIEMDDFGSGYSSLNMLRDAPVDVIKIDRFFLDEVMSTKRGRIIVENSITMSKQLGLRVVAEGVETREQVEFLKGAGCDYAQGYYYSKPISIEEFEKLLL